MMTTCDRELLSLYVSDDVTPAEREAVEAHLATCESCRQAADEYREAALALVSGAGMIAPPPIHRGSTLRVSALRTVAVAAALLTMSVAVWQVPGLAMQVKQAFQYLHLIEATPEQRVEAVKPNDLTEPPRQATTLADAEQRLGYHIATPSDLPPGFIYAGASVPARSPGVDLLLRYEDKEHQRVISIYYFTPGSKIGFPTSDGLSREVKVGDTPAILNSGSVTRHADGSVTFSESTAKTLLLERDGQAIEFMHWESGGRNAIGLLADEALIRMAASLK